MRRKNRSVPAKRRSPDVSWALFFSMTAPAAARVFLDFLGFMDLVEREK
jgi:hypothetical protein